MFKVTQPASAQLKAVLMQQEKKDLFIRIYIKGLGWGGPQFGLALEESVQEERDSTKEVDEVPFVFEKRAAHYLNGKILDFTPQGFTIKDEMPGMGGCSGCTGCSD